MVESAFKTRAVSRAGARGIWQFIRGTGRLYGLRQDYWVDHRFDPEKSTRAAARHLKDLYEAFGDWYLVMAAYNAGPNRVKRAIARTGSRDFWKLSRTRYLRRETRSYVPLILATIVIAKDPERYGFETNFDPPLQYDFVQIESPMDLGTAATCAGTTLAEMKRLNPELRRWVTPLNRPEYSLKIPTGTRVAFCEAVAAIPPEKRVQFVAYTVRRGDTLSHIANKYRTSVKALVDANRIGRRSIIRPGQVLTVPVPDGTLPQQRSTWRRVRAVVSATKGDMYVVQPGDTLSEIADAHGIGLSSLRRWNGLGRRSLIHPGQQLIVRESHETSGEGRVVYRVRRGDTLTKIARRFSVSVEQIRRWNNLTNDRIVAGESLEIYTSSSSS
jgi:membrane-bound lytic murein transglycosylase D